MNKFLLFLVDFVAFFCIVFLTLLLRNGDVSWVSFSNNYNVFFPVFILTCFILWLFSFYDVKELRKANINYKMLSVAFVLVVTLSSAFIYFAETKIDMVAPKTILVAAVFFYFSYVYFGRKSYFKVNYLKSNIFIFGKSKTIDEILAEISASRGFKLRGHEATVSPDAKYNINNLDLVVVGSRLFANDKGAWPVISKKFITNAVCVDTDFNTYERIFRRASKESISDGMWLLRGIGNRKESATYNMLKRAMDLTLSLILLPVLAPLGLLIFILVRIVDGYPPLFTQKRVGCLGKAIIIYKFRTIHPGGTEENITRSGKLLRRFRLDEIPQIINVLKGEISLVGPRPIWANEHAFLNNYIPNHSIRAVVKPGITGWAQLNFKAPPTYFNFRNANPQDIEPEAFNGAFTRFSYDVWYIKNRSLLLDIEILLRTTIRMFIKDKNVS